MTIRACWARITRDRWLSAALLVAAATSLAAAPARKSVAKKKPAPARVAAAAPAPAPRTLAALVRAYRETPSDTRRSAISTWAASHPRDAAAAKLALGVTAYEQKNYTAAVEALQPLGARLPMVADYVAYYLAAARLENGDFAGAAQDASSVRAGVASPLSGQARIVEARALTASQPAEAVRLLTSRGADLPQPDGDLALGAAYQAAGDLAGAARVFQRVYYSYPAQETASATASSALAALRANMGSSYPAPPPELQVRRGDRLLDAHLYTRAKDEYTTLATQLSGLDRDRALVRAGGVDALLGRPTAAPHLRGLQLASPEADAERYYYLAESARRRRDEDGMVAAIGELDRRYPRSPFRAKALAAAVNRLLLNHRPELYVPICRSLYTDFPGDAQAPFCRWRVTFAAYMADQRDAAKLLREHIQQYPWHSTSGSAMYFLARQVEASGDAGGARALYTKVTETFPGQYFAVLARSRLAQANVANAAPSQAMTQFLAAAAFPTRKPPVLERTPATAARIERSRVLRQAGLDDLADGELRFGSRTDSQPWLIAMEMAAAADATHQSLRVMKTMAGEYLNFPLEAAPRQFWELLYPLPWKEDLVRFAGARSLDPYVMAGLIRQESEFNPKAVSRARAYGLTQVLPSTGRNYARQAGLKRFTSAMLFEPETNLQLGSMILRSYFDLAGGRWEDALAAYNAGPGRVVEWRNWGTYREPAEFVESIPILETREYVQAVLRNADVYRRLYGHGGSGTLAARRAP